MRSRRSGLGRPAGDTKVSDRRVTCKAPSAHVEGGSGRPEASPTAILQDTHSVEGLFSESGMQLPTNYLPEGWEKFRCWSRGNRVLITTSRVPDTYARMRIMGYVSI